MNFQLKYCEDLLHKLLKRNVKELYNLYAETVCKIFNFSGCQIFSTGGL